MGRAIWSGAVSFGLVNVPIQLMSAIREQKIHFHMLSPDGGCRLRQKLYCPETGKEFDFKDTARGYEVAPDQYVIIDDEELDKLKPESGDVIKIEEFVKLDEIDLKYLDRTYYVQPGKGGARPYRLLLEALDRTKRVGIGSFVMREREYLAAIRASDGVICLETMYYPEDIVVPEESKASAVDKRELDLAIELVNSWTTKFNPKKFKNEFREDLQEAIEEKAAGKKLKKTSAKRPATGKVINLLDALKKSLKDDNKSSRATTSAKSRSIAKVTAGKRKAAAASKPKKRRA